MTAKKKLIIAILGISLMTGIIPSAVQTVASAQPSVSFQVFYDQLSPFGSWVDYPNYGYVWMPSAGGDFRPYGSRGHWVYSDEGWVWVSDYSWGWATFHYGNWFYDNTYGWMWAPGYQWAPAWVTWGEYGGNYCWAPIGPRIDIGVAFGTYRPPYSYWSFCPRDRITSVNISHYYVNNIHAAMISHITVINNINRRNGQPIYLRGPVAANVERFTHEPIHPVAMQAAARPGGASLQHGQLAIYRPVIRNYNAGVRPARVQDLHALRPASHSNAASTAQHEPAVGHASAVPHASAIPHVTARTEASSSLHPMTHSRVPAENHTAPRPQIVQHSTSPQHQAWRPAEQSHPVQPSRVAQQSHLMPRQSTAQQRPVQHAPAQRPVRQIGMPTARNPQPPENPHEHHR